MKHEPLDLIAKMQPRLPLTRNASLEIHDQEDVVANMTVSPSYDEDAAMCDYIVTCANNASALLECYHVLKHAMALDYFAEGGSTAGWAKKAIDAVEMGLCPRGVVEE